jgi:thiol:disulfide interchange protein
MEAVKKGFGVLLLATAVWLISPVIPGRGANAGLGGVADHSGNLICMRLTPCRRMPRAGSVSGKASASSCC